MQWKDVSMTYEQPRIVERISVVGQLNRGSGPRRGGGRGNGNGNGNGPF